MPRYLEIKIFADTPHFQVLMFLQFLYGSGFYFILKAFSLTLKLLNIAVLITLTSLKLQCLIILYFSRNWRYRFEEIFFLHISLFSFPELSQFCAFSALQLSYNTLIELNKKIVYLHIGFPYKTTFMLNNDHMY